MADEITPDATPAPPPKNKGGRPRKVVAGLRAPPQQAVRDANIAYTKEGRIQVRGRDGEWLTRKRPTNQDQFHIPKEVIPAGMSYQWNTIEVMGQQQVATQLAMAENGWRPVPAGRHSGMFMPADYSANGPIIRDGLRLEERPIELTREAQAEEAGKAGRQMSDQVEQLGMAAKLPSGFTRDNSNLKRMERKGTSREWAPAPDIARPQLPIEE